ncbi:MAG: 50S ribosomal protein L10 [Anaerolineae bacterium]|nr:50S ribosomal protein L10 [Anaerolineae bacterium]
MAFTNKEKQAIVAQYESWLEKSHAVFMLNYTGLTNKKLEGLHRQVREVGAEAHVCKNTLLRIAMNNQGYSVDERLTGTNLVGYAFNDPAALAKVLADLVKENDGKLEFKGGYLNKNELTAADVKSLATLPPLPVMRAQLLGTILAPASKLVRTINEPASQVARVLKAYSEK